MSRKNKVLPESFTPDITLSDRIVKYVSENGIACVQAFSLSADLGIPESELGYYLDHLNIHLKKCQIGLFGYGLSKKLVEKKDRVDGNLKDAVLKASKDRVTTCSSVFAIAESFDLSKIEVGSACETLGIKIRQCRFGAF